MFGASDTRGSEDAGGESQADTFQGENFIFNNYDNYGPPDWGVRPVKPQPTTSRRVDIWIYSEFSLYCRLTFKPPSAN